MPYTSPFAKSVLSDILKVRSVTWDIHRNDEMSGTGDASSWQTELADPMWRATVELSTHYAKVTKEAVAILRSLNGAASSFYLVDPSSPYPAADPTGSILGSSSVTIGTIGSDRNSMSLSGLPGGYKLTAGDKGQILYSSSAKNYFFEVSESVTGGASFQVFPRIPLAITTGASVILKEPACKMFIVPGSFSPGSVVPGFIMEGVSFTAMERR